MNEQELKMPFGKHKGTPVRDLPGDYLKWLSSIELREPLRSSVAAVLACKSVQTASGLSHTANPVRSASTGAATPSLARSEGASGGSQRPEAPKPKRQWIPRPEQEDLSAYYSANSNDGIGF
jgi:uncharacterized protein (DUF3820 family)